MEIRFNIDDAREAANAIAIVNLVYPGMLEQLQQPAIPIVADASVAPGTAEIRQEGKVVGTIVNVGEPAVKYSQDDVNNAITAYATRAGFPAATALLKEFGAGRATQVPEEKRAEFIGKTQETK